MTQYHSTTTNKAQENLRTRKEEKKKEIIENIPLEVFETAACDSKFTSLRQVSVMTA